MKLSAIGVCKWNTDKSPHMLGCSVDLSEFSIFQRGSVKEFMIFTGKTCVQKSQPGARLSVKAQAFMCHVVVRDNHMAAFIFADEAYPSRAAMAVGVKIIEEFTTGNDAWKEAAADGSDAQALCDAAIVKYQDPAEADKLTRIQRELDQTKAILHETIESVLDRGEKLDDLVNKSESLSYASKQFYKQAKKSNQCCTLM